MIEGRWKERDKLHWRGNNLCILNHSVVMVVEEIFVAALLKAYPLENYFPLWLPCGEILRFAEIIVHERP